MGSLQLTGIVPFIVSLLLYIFVGPVLLLLLLINELARLVVSVYLNLKYRGKVRLVSDGNDASWACKMPERSRMVIVATKLEQKLDFESLVNLVEKVLLYRNSNGERRYEKLESILTNKCGYPCWKRDDLFNVRNHSRCLSTNTVHTESDLKQIFKKMSEDMDESRPQWEYILIPRYKDNDERESTMLCTRFQHAYIDGVSLCMMLNDVLTSNFTYYIDPLKFEFPLLKRLLFYTSAIVFGPYALIRLAMKNFESQWPVLKPQEFIDNPIERNFAWSPQLSLDDIKKIKKAFKGKINVPTIIENAFISAAVETLPRKRLPEEWSIGEVVAMLPYPNSNPQNRFTGYTYCVSDLGDDFSRLKKAQENVYEGILGPSIPMIYFVFKLSGRLPLRIIRWGLSGGVHSMVYSNVPLSKTTMALRMQNNNNEVLEGFAFPPQPNNTGIILAGITYRDKVKLSANAVSNWLTREELEEVVAKVPKVIESWVAKVNKMQLINEKRDNST